MHHEMAYKDGKYFKAYGSSQNQCTLLTFKLNIFLKFKVVELDNHRIIE